MPLGSERGLHLLAVLEGEVDVDNDPAGRPLRLGETMLVGAACSAVSVTARQTAVMLDITLPDYEPETL